MVPSASAVGESIIKEKDCEIIGKELDSNIECRFIVGLSEGSSVSPPLCPESATNCQDKPNLRMPQYYDQERNILYFGHSNTWMHDYIAVEMDNFTIVEQIQCEGITTGTYVETTTYPCELQIESKEHKYPMRSVGGGDFIQYEEDIIFAEVKRSYSSDFGSWCKSWVALYNYDGKKIRWLDDYHNWGSNNQCWSTDLENRFVQQSKTTVPYIYYVVTSGEDYRGTAGAKGLGKGLHVIEGTGNFPDIHSYKTDKRCGNLCKIFLNEDKNELYYFVGNTMYQIKGMGEIESTPTPTAAVSEPVSKPVQKASTECSSDYTFVDGMCTKQYGEEKLGAKWRWDFSDTLAISPKLSIQVKLIDPSGKTIQDRFVASHGKLAIEFPETGMVGDYQLIWQYYSGSKVIWQVRHIIPIVGEEQQSSVGCGAGTVMVNGVCQLTQTSGTSTGIEPIYIVIAAVAIGGGAVGALFALKRGSGTPKPAREEIEEYESEYVARKPAEKKETSSSCNSCGKPLKPTAKFCGECGTPRS